MYSQASYLHLHLRGGLYNIRQAYYQLEHQIIGCQVYFMYLAIIGGHFI